MLPWDVAASISPAGCRTIAFLGRQKQQRGEDTDGRPLAQVYFCFWKASRDGSRQKGLTAERRLSPSTGPEANDLLP